MNPARTQRLSWWNPAFGEEEAAAVAGVIRAGYVNEGERTTEFARRMAAFLGIEHVLATCSGTAALFLALKASGVGPGDEVLVPDLTFIATANAVALCGARPVLVDVRAGDLNMDPELASRAITPRTKAILPVHINGRPADVVELRETADRHGVALIEDAAQALGSTWRGQALGTFGDLGCISLAPTKVITSGQGGLVVTRSSELRDKIVRLKDHGRLSRSSNTHSEVGFNFKYSDIQAALADSQLDRLPERLDRARHQYQFYRSGFEGVPHIEFIRTDIDGGSVPLWVDVLVDDAVSFVAYMNARLIECRRFWPAIHTQSPYAVHGSFANATRAAEHGVWLPSGAGKSDDDLSEVIATARSFLCR